MKLTPALGLLVVSLLLGACQSSPAMTPAPTITQSPEPTQARPPTATPTPSVSIPVLSPEPESFHHLRLEYTTTSDWSTLDLQSAARVMAARQVKTVGEPDVQVGVPTTALGQPIEAAEAGQQVGVTIDLAVDAEAAQEPFEILVQKGDIGRAQVRLYALSGATPELLGELAHSGVVAGSLGRNPVTLTIDLARLDSITPEARPERAGSFPKLLWAFYYPWYTSRQWNSNLLIDHPLEPYNSADRGTIERHVRQAKEAGIDGFISSWWGPGGDTDDNLRTLLDVAAEQDFSVTVYFETLTEDDHLPQHEIVRWLTYLLRTHGNHPAFAQVDGRPVVFLWASGAVPLGTWKAALDEVRQAGVNPFTLGMGYSLSNLEVFDGLHEYGVFTIEDLEGTVLATGKGVRSYNLLTEDGQPRLWAATVQPGYDDRLIPGREGLLQERGDGDFYRRTWDAALRSSPDWILITTWNEWWEHTHIEPSQGFGELYLDITRDYARAWKGG